MVDGTVQHMTDDAYAKKQAYSDKVCFEQKECYEHQAQNDYRPSIAEIAHSGSAPSPAAPIRLRQKKKSGCLPAVGILVAASVLFSALMGMLDNDRQPDGAGGQADSLFSVGRDGWERDDYWREAGMDESFLLPDGTVMAVTGVAWSGSDRCYRIYMTATGSALPSECTLYLRDQPGENLYMAIEYEILAQGVYSFPVGIDNIVPDHVVFGCRTPDGEYKLICVYLEW